MKAIVYTKYGGPEVLELKEINKPSPGENEVLVKVYATSLNDWDWSLLQGATLFDRMLSGFSKPKREILGSDIAGRIESVGKHVQRFKPGDEVFGDLSGKWGGFAEFVCASENALALKPSGMTFEEAAAIPQAGMLAVQGLIDKGKVQRGQKLLINGAGGGVGTFAIQISKLYELEVTAVDSGPKLNMLRELGARHVIDYTKEDFTKNEHHYDLILDTKTNRRVFDYLRVLSPNGTYVTVGGSIQKLLKALLMMPVISLFSKKKVHIVMLKANKDLNYISQLFESGKLKPLIDGHYTLENVREAFTHFGKANHKGKIVISIQHQAT